MISFDDSHQNFGDGNSFSIDLTDIDGDGDPDVFITNYFQPCQVYINSGTGVFSLKQNISGTQAHSVALEDLNGDGHPDVFLVYNGLPNKVLFNDGTGQFTDSGQMLGGNPDELAVWVTMGDIDNDGDQDALVGQSPQGIMIWLNNGNGFFSNSGSMGGSATLGFVLGDLNGDDSPDLIILYNNAPDSVYFNNGSGIFINSGQGLAHSPDGYESIALGDLDGDGDQDAFLTNTVHGNKTLLNDGAGQFAESGNFFGNPAWSLTLSDLDKDGDQDAITSNWQDQSYIYVNDGTGGFSLSGALILSAASNIVVLEDVNNDGYPDAFIGKEYGNGGTKLLYNTTYLSIGVVQPVSNDESSSGQVCIYPNPSSGKATIEFGVKQAGDIRLLLMDSSGKEIKSLLVGMPGPGTCSLEIDLSGINPGLYFYCLKTGTGIICEKMIVCR
jgi:hypothetical protein